jgi:hypothetical protein
MEGTWDVQVTLRNCQTGAPVKTARTLSTFSNAGTLVETGTDDTPVRLSSGQGTWRHIGERHYITVSRFFRFDPNGAYAEIQKITRRLELSDDGKEFLATTCVEVFDKSDSLIETGCATERGKRLE